MSTLYKIADRGAAKLAIAATVVTALIQLNRGFSEPWIRWGAWLLIALLFALAGYLYNVRLSRILGPSSQPFYLKNWWRFVYYTLAVVFVVVFACDVRYTLTRPPAKLQVVDDFTPRTSPGLVSEANLKVNSVTSLVRGYTEATDDNILIREGVTTVGFTRSLGFIGDYPFTGETISTLIEKPEGVRTLTIHSMRVQVTRFEPMPPYLGEQLYGAGADKLEASFVLRIRTGDPFPWQFEAQFARLNFGDPSDPDRVFPYNIEGDAPVALRYHFSALDAGVYWVEPIVVVSEGAEGGRDMKFTDKPIPVGFAAFDEAFYNEHLDRVADIAASNGDKPLWIPWPPISNSEQR